MTADTPTCPYCNAAQLPMPGLMIGQRVSCPRCGESYKVTSLPADIQTLPAASPTPGHAPAPQVAPTVTFSNRAVGLVVLGVMLIMAATGLTYALMTVKTRREHDRALPRKPRRPWLTEPPVAPEAAATTELAGLGYLPPSTGLVAAVHIEELLASPAGKELRSRPLKIGNVDFTLDSVRGWTGIDAEDLEHVVLGVTVRNGDEADLTPAVHLVARTRRPYPPERVRVALKAGKSREGRTPEGGRRTLYSASVGKLPVQLWLADERTVVVGLFSTMDEVPGKPGEGLEQLPAELRQTIERRVAPGAPAWVAGHSADWKKTWLPALAGGLKDFPLLDRLGEVRSFALWLVASQPAKVAGAFRCSTEAAARELEQAELAPRQKAHSGAFKYSREGEWLDVQLTLEEK